MELRALLSPTRWRRRRRLRAHAKMFIRDFRERAEAVALAETDIPGQSPHRAAYYRALAALIRELVSKDGKRVKQA